MELPRLTQLDYWFHGLAHGPAKHQYQLPDRRQSVPPWKLSRTFRQSLRLSGGQLCQSGRSAHGLESTQPERGDERRRGPGGQIRATGESVWLVVLVFCQEVIGLSYSRPQ